MKKDSTAAFRRPICRRILWSQLLLFSAPSVLAEGVEPEEPVPLERYVVVAYRSERPVSQISPSTSVLTDEDFADWQMTTVTDALQQMAGMTLFASGQSGALRSLFTRGTNSDHTMVLFNGRKLNPGFSGVYNLSLLRLDGVEQVEVLRGASSTLYGSEGIGGVINIVTRRAQGKSVYLEAGGGSFDTVSMAVGTDYRVQDLRVNVGGSWMRTANDEPNHDYEQSNLQVSVDYALNENLTLDVQALFFDALSGTPGNRKAEGFPQMADFQDTCSWIISPRFRIQMGEKIGVSMTYSRSEDTLVGKTTTVFGGFAFASFNDFKTAVDQADLQVDVDFRPGIKINAGFTYLHEGFLQEDLGEFALDRFPADDSWNSRSVFAQVQWDLPNGFYISGGVRYDRYSDFDSPLTGDFRVSYRYPYGNLTLFFKSATGYSIPQAFDIYGAYGNPFLKSEQSDGWELGLKQSLWEDRIQWSALYFHNYLTNLIEFPSVFTPGSTTENVGLAETSGVEFTLTSRPAEFFSLYLHYTYLEADDLDKDTRLARRPRHQLNAGMMAHLSENLDLGLSLRHVADREDIDGATFSQGLVDNFTVVGFRVNWHLRENLTLFARLDNLFDEAYDEVDGFRALGRGAFAGIRAAWK